MEVFVYNLECFDLQLVGHNWDGVVLCTPPHVGQHMMCGCQQLYQSRNKGCGPCARVCIACTGRANTVCWQRLDVCSSNVLDLSSFAACMHAQVYTFFKGIVFSGLGRALNY
jgi:hypothetical protein